MDTADTNIHIAPATEADISLILSFIKGLAEYERLLNEVVATEEILRENLFGSKRYAEVIIARYGNEPAGFAIFFHNFSTFLGRPEFISKTFLCFRNFARRESAGCYSHISPDSPSNVSAAGWNGQCSSGIKRQ